MAPSSIGTGPPCIICCGSGALAPTPTLATIAPNLACSCTSSCTVCSTVASGALYSMRRMMTARASGPQVEA